MKARSDLYTVGVLNLIAKDISRGWKSSLELIPKGAVQTPVYHSENHYA